MNNWVRRLLTGCVLFLVLWLAIFQLTNHALYLFSLIFLALAAWEWSAFLLPGSAVVRWIYVAIMVAVFLLVSVLPFDSVLWVGCVWWVVALFLLLAHGWTMTQLSQKGLWVQGVKALMGFLVLIPAWVALVTIHAMGPWYLFSTILLVACFDIGAYVLGVSCGRHKILPRVSPGKSVEGLLGGFLLALTFFTATLWCAGLLHERPLVLFVVSVVVLVFGVVGDLFESMQKRLIGIKDSGSILPGHGGLLDRMDSITSALPFCAMAIVLLGL